MPSRPPVGQGDPAAARTLFVLGGGGSLGAYQAGAIVGLAEDGLVPDGLLGCSAGALNAAFLAAGPSLDRARELAAWWISAPARTVLSPGLWARVRGFAAAATARSDGLLDGRPLRRMVAEHVHAHDLSELAVPLTVTTTCLDCGTQRHHDRGPVGDLLLASCALPGLFPPVRLADGHRHVDGGVVCGVPVQAALDAAGPRDTIVVLDCALAPITGRSGACAALAMTDSRTERAAQEEACGLPTGQLGRVYVAPVESSRGALDVVLKAFTVARAAANRASTAEALDDPRVRVVPHVADAWATGLLADLPAGPRDFTCTPALVEAGRAAAHNWLATAPITSNR